MIGTVPMESKYVIMQNEEDKIVKAMSLHREGGGGFSQELQ